MTTRITTSARQPRPIFPMRPPLLRNEGGFYRAATRVNGRDPADPPLLLRRERLEYPGRQIGPQRPRPAPLDRHPRDRRLLHRDLRAATGDEHPQESPEMGLVADEKNVPLLAGNLQEDLLRIALRLHSVRLCDVPGDPQRRV